MIPDAVELSGTIRALTTEHFARLHSRVAKVPLCISSVLWFHSIINDLRASFMKLAHLPLPGADHLHLLPARPLSCTATSASSL